ncbi:hypothetical protein AGMMS50239_24650 [Bacteroidia bacterium]|nr:hypothetical protein AGMMS50239_24650 [Bacteroidia bacterium]
MKKYFLLSIIAILSFSCVDDEGGEIGGHGYRFFPRKVSYLFVLPLEQVIRYVPGLNGEVMQYTDYKIFRDDALSKNVFQLGISTSNCDLFSLEDPMLYNTILDDHIPEIERQLAQDYEKQSKQKKSGSPGGLDAFNWIDIEYRTTPIRNLTISSLNTPLFGKAAGESLNDFFDILGYGPSAIVSYPSNSLIYGNTSKEFPKAIDEWLSLYPYAQAGMRLAPNKAITGLPVDVQFVVRMETHEGLVLLDTTQMFTITE